MSVKWELGVGVECASLRSLGGGGSAGGWESGSGVGFGSGSLGVGSESWE